MGDYNHYYPFISQIEIQHDITHQEERKSNRFIALGSPSIVFFHWLVSD